MTSPATDTAALADAGLLSPVRAGSGADELLGDDAYLRAMLETEIALAETQAHLGIVPASSVGPITEAARSGRIDPVALARGARDAANPVVGLVAALTAEVAALDPRAAEHVHHGSTSQDILDTAAMLVATRALRHIDSALIRTADALAELAVRHRDTPVAGRTLTQHAVPVTFGLKAAGWLTLVLDASDRIRRPLTPGLPVQLGGAAGTLAAYNAVARGTPAADAGGDLPGLGTELAAPLAARLGLAAPPVPWHALRTPVADLGAALAFTCGALGKLALDVQGMARTEVGEVAEPGGEGRGASSAMPQKRNPVLATLITSAARQVPPLALILTQSLIAEDERAPGAWHAEWQPLREALRLTAGAADNAAELAAGLSVFPARMLANLELSGGALHAERLGVALAPALGKKVAKRLLARLTAPQEPGGGPSFAERLATAPETAGRFTGPEGTAALKELLEPAGYLGASGLLVDRVLTRHATHGPATTHGHAINGRDDGH